MDILKGVIGSLIAAVIIWFFHRHKNEILKDGKEVLALFDPSKFSELDIMDRIALVTVLLMVSIC